MRYINGDGFYIALLELLPLKTLLYSTTLSYTRSIIFSRVFIFPSSHSIKERPLGALSNIINTKLIVPTHRPKVKSHKHAQNTSFLRVYTSEYTFEAAYYLQ